jgi:hypothetical protein
MVVDNTMIRSEQLGFKIDNQYKVHYLVVIPFIFVAFVLLIVFARFDTITHYVHRAMKKDAIYLMRKVVVNQPNDYYERKYDEIRKNGFFWKWSPIVVESEEKLKKEQMKKVEKLMVEQKEVQ